MTEADERFDRSRRRFIRGAVLGVGAASLGAMFSDRVLEVVTGFSPEDVPEGPGPRWGMVIDLDKCTGQFQCAKACQKSHFVPEGQQWLTVYARDVEPGETTLPEPGHGYRLEDTFEGDRTRASFLPRPCFHCDRPPCRDVCPVGATFKRDDGLVLIDHEKCIGCRYCMAACPYNARVFNWGEPPHTPEELAHEYSPEAPWPHRKGTVDKCDFCIHEAKEGRLPHCVTACPNGVYYFGDLREDAVSNGREVIRFSETLRTRSGFRLKEEQSTLPRVWYLPKKGA